MTTFTTSREIPATVAQVFAAISQPERLARWWGPAGFTNTFQVCDFQQGGRWSFVMHGPDGANYANENVFAEIESPNRVVVDHTGEPKFRLTISLSPAGPNTVVSWSQVLESEEVAKRIEHIVIPANEQNLERLSAEVLREAKVGLDSALLLTSLSVPADVAALRNWPAARPRRGKRSLPPYGISFGRNETGVWGTRICRWRVGTTELI